MLEQHFALIRLRKEPGRGGVRCVNFLLWETSRKSKPWGALRQLINSSNPLLEILDPIRSNVSKLTYISSNSYSVRPDKAL
mmetsp:Transcript_119/g.259  ORF Transcript_119/g.259 Transcript_119/m.259 type:complete len:81 (-) Transcript_119:779-1021(-)